MTERTQRFLVTGLYDLRSCVLALPKLAALRAVSPHQHITIIAPHGARDLLLRLRVADHVRVINGNAFSTMAWVMWQKITRHFDGVIAADDLREGIKIGWQKLSRDLSFVLPAQKFIALVPPQGWPAVRAAALVRKLNVEGYAVVLLGLTSDKSHARLVQAAPDLIDLTGRIDLADMPVVAEAAVATLGGCDALTALAALSGGRAVIVTQGADDAVDILPHANTTWIQSDNIADVSVGDVMKVIA